MPKSIGLFDRDAFLKLGCCDLWEETLQCFGVTHPYRLASTTSAAATRRKLTRLLPPVVVEAACDRLAGMVAAVPVLPTELVAAGRSWMHLSRLLAIPDIGPDALLASVFFALREDRILVTGDKRFIAGLRDAIQEDFQAMGDDIVSFEACLRAVAEMRGAKFVGNRVRDVVGCDGSLRLAVGQDGQASDADFLQALRSLDPKRPSLA